VSETITIEKDLFHRICRAVISVEQMLKEKDTLQQHWLSEADALALLGCKRTKLWSLKSSGKIKYKAVGRQHQYSRKSIEKYIEEKSN
jgi:hypothetical protein